ncbi:MAG: redoxin domain-containing protein, partial [Bacteroidota bacterium]
VIQYQKGIIEKYPDLLISKFIRMNMEVETPEAPAGMSEEEAGRWKYYWYRTHYWDNCDLADPRMVRDQQFHRLLDSYINRTLPMIPDTMCVEARKLIERTGTNEDAYKYIVHFITYFSETSKVMCMDRLFVYMVDNYYTKAKASWMKDDKLAEMKKSADEKRSCLCGEVAPDIILPDRTGKNWVSMKKSAGKYTMLVIWESTCGHCKKEVPKLLDLYHKWKDKGLVTYAIGNDLENDKWIKFVDENELDWINVSDTPEIMKQDSASKLIWGGVTTLQSLNYRTTWDVNSTPKVYLMDKDMKIIAKQLSAEQFDELIQRLESGEKVDMQNMKSHEYEDDEEAPKPGKGVIKSRSTSPPRKGP